jgi:hypothetical protein
MLKTTYCTFPKGGRCQGLVAENLRDRVRLYFMALFRPTKYRLGTANGQLCIWWATPETGEKS